MGADFGVGIADKFAERIERGGVFRGELAECPDGVEAGVGAAGGGRAPGLRRGARRGRAGEGGERGDTGGTALGEGELGFLADALVGVG